MLFWFLSSFPLCLGKPQSPSGIVGGEVVPQGSFPWLVNRNNMCGGALIAPNWFVTAGHCDMVVGEFVEYHRWDMNAKEPQAERHQVAQLVVYPDYNLSDTTTDLHDLQLVRLKTTAVNTPLARLLTPDEEATFEAPYFKLTVAGWGTTEAVMGAQPSSRLRAVQVPIISNDECNDEEHYGANSPPWLPKRVYDTMFCAGFEDGGFDSCLGDSGDPAFTVVNGTGVLIGIVSWAVGCARAHRPGVYTRLSSYRDWIETVIASTNTTDSQGPPSCVDNCGRALRGCFCDVGCPYNNDCCRDFRDVCGALAAEAEAPPDLPSCIGKCGGAGGQGCMCDWNCTERVDCCIDFYESCKKPGTVFRSNADTEYPPTYYDSCENLCGTLSKSTGGSYCYCDSGCEATHTCCEDYSVFCAPSEDVSSTESNENANLVVPTAAPPPPSGTKAQDVRAIADLGLVPPVVVGVPAPTPQKKPASSSVVVGKPPPSPTRRPTGRPTRRPTRRPTHRPTTRVLPPPSGPPDPRVPTLRAVISGPSDPRAPTPRVVISSGGDWISSGSVYVVPRHDVFVVPRKSTAPTSTRALAPSAKRVIVVPTPKPLATLASAGFPEYPDPPPGFPEQPALPPTPIGAHSLIDTSSYDQSLEYSDTDEPQDTPDKPSQGKAKQGVTKQGVTPYEIVSYKSADAAVAPVATGTEPKKLSWSDLQAQGARFGGSAGAGKHRQRHKSKKKVIPKN